jgi:Hemerythrin HHE cation binding domain
MPTNRTASTTSSSRSSATRSTARPATKAREDILKMLKDDHRKAKKAFRDFEKLDPAEDPEACQQIVEQTCAELTLHATLEEELFYPAARGVIREEDLIDEAEVEHMTAKQLIAQLQGMGPEDDKYAATFKVLGEYIEHHVKEEENEMFPQLTRAKLDWESLLEEMNERRAELAAKLPGEAPRTQA